MKVMNFRQRVCLVSVSLVALAAACDGGSDTTDDESLGGSAVDGELGTLSLSLEADPAASFDGLVATVTLTPSQGTATRVDHAITGSGFTELVRVVPGTYTVAVDVKQDGDSAPAYSGQVANVSVLAGKMTALAVPLTPTGGVQVSVRLPVLGTAWTCQPTVDASSAVAVGGRVRLLRGAQRVERGDDGVWRPTYYLWVCGAGCRLLKTSTLDGSGNPLWNFASAVASDFAYLAPDLVTLWATGAGFYAMDDQSLLESSDGVTWSKVTGVSNHNFQDFSGPVAPGQTTRLPGGWVRGCGVVVDDATHRFCHVFDDYLRPGPPTDVVLALQGLVMASSPDGLGWEIFPPLRPDVTDRVSNPEVAFTSAATGTSPVYISTAARQVAGAYAYGGVYQVIAVDMFTGIDRSISLDGFGSYVSSDGEAWLYRNASFTCGTTPRPTFRDAWALFVVDGKLHLYFPTTNTDLAHLTSAK